MTSLYFDTETYSEVPIKHGTYKYLENAECMLAQFSFDKDAPTVVDFTDGQVLPKDVRQALTLGGVDIKAHNAMFDRNVVRYALNIDTPMDAWHCLMVRALQHGLPGGLDKLSEIFKLGVDAKDKDGKRLIQLFCKPMPKNSKIRRATKDTHPVEWAAFIEYARQDIPPVQRLDEILPRWNMTATERAYYLLDQRRNDRGMLVDLDLVKQCLRAVDAEQKRLKTETILATDGELMSTTQRAAMLEFILEQFGVSLPDLQSSTLELRLKDPDIPEEIKELLRIRLQVSTSSTSKYRALDRGVNLDGRLRGTIQFCGAQRTGRDAGRTFQPQNLPSRGLLPNGQVESGISAIMAGVEHLAFDNVMLLTASTIRGAIIAPEGKKLTVSDLSNIEGRLLAWEAGEEWKLQAFRDYDAGTGHDLYNLTYAKSFSVDVTTVNKSQRQIGKVQELALGYEGGVGAFVAFALAYGIDLDALADIVYDTLPRDTVKEAASFHDWLVNKKKSTAFGLKRETFIMCDSFKRLWREAHPMTTKLWAALQENTIAAIKHPGETYRYRNFTFRRDGNWFRLGLPSGRVLPYPAPQVDEKGGISYMGMNQYTKQWSRIHTHGGKLAENITQALARDVFKHGELLAEEHGYLPVIPVHDEAVTEAPDTEDYSCEGLAELLATNPDWAVGLPLAAAGFESYRYRKD